MESKKKIIFIINPISGGIAKGLVEDIVNSQLNVNKFDWEIIYTTHAGHGVEIAESACKSGIDIVVAVGGDGTINEIASVLVNSSTALGIIPCGSGNGLARHLHIPLEYSKAVDLLNEADIKAVDYGTINGRPFFCTCGMGFDAYISAIFDKSVKRGPLGYLENVIKEVANYKTEDYILIDDSGNETKCNAFCIACANASQYGNNAYIAPQASMEDGLIDVTIVEPFNVAMAPILAAQFMNGTFGNRGNIKMFKTRQLTVIRKDEGYLHRDGEPFWGGKEILIKAQPQQLRVVYNKKAKIKPIPFWQSLSIGLRNKVYANTSIGQTIKNSNKELLEKLHIKDSED